MLFCALIYTGCIYMPHGISSLKICIIRFSQRARIPIQFTGIFESIIEFCIFWWKILLLRLKMSSSISGNLCIIFMPELSIASWTSKIQHDTSSIFTRPPQLKIDTWSNFQIGEIIPILPCPIKKKTIILTWNIHHTVNYWEKATFFFIFSLKNYEQKSISSLLVRWNLFCLVYSIFP